MLLAWKVSSETYVNFGIPQIDIAERPGAVCRSAGRFDSPALHRRHRIPAKSTSRERRIPRSRMRVMIAGNLTDRDSH